MNHYFEAFKRYAQFDGKTTRQGYWVFVLINFFAVIAISVTGALVHANYLALVYQVAVFIPSMAIGIRRAHDVGKSGWFLCIPIYGFVILVSASAESETPTGSPPLSELHAGGLKNFEPALPAPPLRKVGS